MENVARIPLKGSGVPVLKIPLSGGLLQFVSRLLMIFTGNMKSNSNLEYSPL